VPLEGDLDVTVVPRLRRVLDDLIDGGCRRIVINMAGCDYVDSAGMALIFCEVRRMRAVGGLVSLVNVGERVMRALRICRLVDFVPVTGTGARGEVPRLDPKVVPDWRCTVPIDPCSLDQARSRFAQLVAGMPFTDDEAFDLTLAVGEAMGNAVDHTCGEGALLTVASYPDRVVVDVTDCGEGFELAAQEPPPASAGGLERGRGIRLMRLLVDSVSIESRGRGVGTRVRIVKLVHIGA
jgi:anti-anti-sigma factor